MKSSHSSYFDHGHDQCDQAGPGDLRNCQQTSRKWVPDSWDGWETDKDRLHECSRLKDDVDLENKLEAGLSMFSNCKYLLLTDPMDQILTSNKTIAGLIGMPFSLSG